MLKSNLSSRNEQLRTIFPLFITFSVDRRIFDNYQATCSPPLGISDPLGWLGLAWFIARGTNVHRFWTLTMISDTSRRQSKIFPHFIKSLTRKLLHLFVRFCVADQLSRWFFFQLGWLRGYFRSFYTNPNHSHLRAI